ncbi:hypothetical protein E6H23_04455 [Candidatus Bathyarchaeota archaeon]|nr:MAG: hypothetical protein E6H23_04455 [Candidatus Bathyarchaeota archaeon]
MAIDLFVNGKRDSILILYDILKIASVNPVSITRVTYGANLNHSSARRYLTHLQTRGLIESVDRAEGRYYMITSKGAEAARELERILRNVGTEKAVNPFVVSKR